MTVLPAPQGGNQFQFVAIFFLGVFIPACVYDPVSPDSAPLVPDKRIFSPELTNYRNNMANVIVTVEKGVIAPTCKLHIDVDSTNVADMRGGERIKLFLAPGLHTIDVGSITVTRNGTGCNINPKTKQFRVNLDRAVLLRIEWSQGYTVYIDVSNL